MDGSPPDFYYPPGWTGERAQQSRSAKIESEEPQGLPDTPPSDDFWQEFPGEDVLADLPRSTPEPSTSITRGDRIYLSPPTTIGSSSQSATGLSSGDQTRSSPATSIEPSQDSDEAFLECSKCTLINDPSLDFCYLCGSSLLSEDVPPRLDLAIQTGLWSEAQALKKETGSSPVKKDEASRDESDNSLFVDKYGASIPQYQGTGSSSDAIGLTMSDDEDAVDLTTEYQEHESTDGPFQVVVDLTTEDEEDGVSIRDPFQVVDVAMKEEDDDFVEIPPEEASLFVRDEVVKFIEGSPEGADIHMEDEDEVDDLEPEAAYSGQEQMVSPETKPRGKRNKVEKKPGRSRRQDSSRKAKSTLSKFIAIKTKRPSREPIITEKAKKTTLNGGVKGVQEHSEFLGYDPIAAHNAEPEIEEAPSIEASTKTKQRADLLAACPLGSDPRRNITDVNAIIKASRAFGREKVKAKNGFWLLDGMNSPLYHHQLLAVAWMFRRETSSEGPSGGIIADSMGLGKTIQMLGLMAANQPPGDLHASKTATLVIVPAALIEQWQEEKYEHMFKDLYPHVRRYKASNKDGVVQTELQDIVIASYWEVTHSCPWFNKKDLEVLRKKGRKKKARAEDDDTCHIEAAIEYKLSEEGGGLGGDLHKVTWFRVVLDEAHFIKNHLSRRSFAVNALKSTHRWGLSGTPIMNRPEEWYSMFRFLRALPGVPYPDFKLQYCDYTSESCNKKMRALVSSVMLRRTVQSKLLGRDLVTLPTPHPHKLTVECTAEERILIGNIERRFLELSNQEYDDGDLRNSFRNPLHQLTRLRQMTVDVLTIPREFKILFEVEDLRRIQEELSEVPNSDGYIYNEINKWIEEKVADDPLLQADENQNEKCPWCNDDFDQPQKICVDGCRHVFDRACLEMIMFTAEEQEMEPICPLCSAEFDVEDIEDVVTKSSSSRASRQETDDTDTMGPEKKGKDSRGYRPKPNRTQFSAMEWFSKHDARQGEQYLSSKLKALKAEITTFQWGRLSDKKIIFVQWIQAAVMIGTLLEELGIGFVYYWGDMNRDQRAAATAKIEDSPHIEYMISGLKCGGIGLNWTWANQVIIVDPWWNLCVESQAFCRVHRIKQTKECHLITVSVEDTVDDRLLELQENKRVMLKRTTPNELTSEEMEFLLGRHRIARRRERGGGDNDGSDFD